MASAGDHVKNLTLNSLNINPICVQVGANDFSSVDTKASAKTARNLSTPSKPLTGNPHSHDEVPLISPRSRLMEEPIQITETKRSHHRSRNYSHNSARRIRITPDDSDNSDDSSSGSVSDDDSNAFLNTKMPKHKRIFSTGFSDCRVRTLRSAADGRADIKLAEKRLSGLIQLRRDLTQNGTVKPLQGARIAGCTHITAYSAVMIETLVELGATVRWCSCNFYSTSDDIAAALATNSIPIFAWHGMTESHFWWCIDKTCSGTDAQGNEWLPNIILDDGGDLTQHVHKTLGAVFSGLHGVVESSHAGLKWLYNIQRQQRLTVSAMNIKDGIVKRKVDTTILSRETLVECLKRSTDFMFRGKPCLVIGYGQVGKGCVQALLNQNCRVFVAEIDPICALTASLDGCEVVRLEDAIHKVDVVVTATGCKHVLGVDQVRKMKTGAILANMGHFEEINTASIRAAKDIVVHSVKAANEDRCSVDHIQLGGTDEARHVILLADGHVLNFTCCPPPFTFSVTCCTEVLALCELYTNNKKYKNDIYLLPRRIDERIASIHLPLFQAQLSKLTEHQAKSIGRSRSGPFKDAHYNY